MFIKPTYRIENKLYQQGYKNIAGLDEAGRGAWAGPVVAAAVALPPKLKIIGLRDSKLLSPNKRDKLYSFINKNALSIGVGIVSEKIIDKFGIIVATRRAFLRALEKVSFKVDYLLVDGTEIFKHKLPIDFLIKGDNRVMSIAAASIIAKVTRDSILKDYHNKYPKYGFNLHKGYGTKQHRRRLNKYGVCDIHRLSYRPMLEFS
jgi:ribonuclease HII